MTPITYKEASEILGVSMQTIYEAAKDGRITVLPREGLIQKVIREQIELYQGKIISISALSPEERSKWQEYNDAVVPASDLLVALLREMTKPGAREVLSMLVALLKDANSVEDTYTNGHSHRSTGRV